MASIAELILEQGRQQANERQRQGDIRGSMWQNLAQIAANYGKDVRQQQADAPRREMEQLALNDARQHAQGQQTLDTLLKPYQPVGPQQEGDAPAAPQHPYLGADGLYDTAKIQSAFAAQGVAHLAPEILKNVDALNDSVTKHRAAVKQAADSKTVLLGDLADTAQKMHKQGTPLDQALDFAAQSGLTTGAIDPQEYQRSRAQILQLPPDQQERALTTLMDNAARIAPEKDLAKDAKRLDRYNRETASNVDPNEGGYTINGQRFKKDGTPLGPVQPVQTPATPRSLDEQLLEAITKGDKLSADRITQTLRAAAAAKQDPAALASLEATRLLTREAAQARLDKLKEENAPLDVTPQIQTTLLAGGMKYLDSSKYGKAELAKARKAAEAAGIPVVSKETADGLIAADRAATTLDGMWAQLKPFLPADASGRLIGGARNTLDKAFQSNPTLGAFGTWRTAAVQAVQALAEKGMGLRLNQVEIGNLLEGLPKITDDAPTAEQKMKNIGIQLESKVKNALTQDRSTLGVPGGTIAPGAAPATDVQIVGRRPVQ